MLTRKLAFAALTGVVLLGAAPAGAQYYDPYGRPPPPRYDYDRPPPPYGYDRPRYNDDRGYDRPYRARRFGDMCETSRGTCETRPTPVGSSCRCYIEGFGEKRGIIQ